MMDNRDDIHHDPETGQLLNGDNEPVTESGTKIEDIEILESLPSFETLDYQQGRKDFAKKLGLSLGALDKLVKHRDQERVNARRKQSFISSSDFYDYDDHKNQEPEELPGDSEVYKVINSLVSQIDEVNLDHECRLIGWRPKNDKPPSMKNFKVAIAKKLLSIAREKNWHLATDGGFFYCYNGSHWLPMTEAMVKNLAIKAAIKMEFREIDAREEGFVTSLHRQIIQDGFFPRRGHNAESLINLRNGTLVLSEGEPKLRAFSYRDFLTHQLDFDFDPSATNPLFLKFLSEVLPDPYTQKTLQQVAGFLFVKGLKLERIFFLLGTGSNGKSVFFDVFTGVIGKVNTTNYSAESLTDEKGYHRAMIQNVIVNYGSDVRFKEINPGFFKALASGEPVEAREPYGKPFIMHEYAKLIFNVNKMDSLSMEDTHGFIRRLLIIPFDQIIPTERQDRDLSGKILQNKAGILNWIIEGAREVITTRDVFVSAQCQQAIDKFVRESNNVAMYVEDWRKENRGINYNMRVTEAYKNYLSVCQEAGRRYPCSRNEFARRMTALGFVHVEGAQGSFLKKAYENGDGDE